MVTKNAFDAGAPRLVGRYELVVPIVSGALGELWQARIASGPEEGRTVDIRLIPRSSGQEMRHVERLTNAGFAAMELRHPRIAAVLDVVVGATEIAIVSEHIAGAVLQTLLRSQAGKRVSVPIGVASRVALDLLEAVDAVRAPWMELFDAADDPEDALLGSCVHGGLLPDGLLVASFGETILLEAGLAGVALTIPSILDHPDVIAYRAPEQLEPGRPMDARADVFTIGVLYWEMITGRSLFGPSVMPRPDADTPAKASAASDPVQVSAARRRVLSHPIPRLDSLPLLKGKVPKALSDMVARCLERDPALRFQTARDAIQALAVLDHEGLSRHDSVMKLVSALAVRQTMETPLEVEEEAPSSNRPTTPPIDPDTEKSPEADLASSTDIESVPPSSAEMESVPSLDATAVAVAEFAGVEGSVTLMSGATPPERERPAAVAKAAAPASAVDETAASAPVASPLDAPAGQAEAAADHKFDDPVFSERRDKNRRIIVFVMAGAALVVLFAILRTAMSRAGGEPSAPANAPSAVATQAVGSPSPPVAPETEAAPVVPAVASSVLPTNAPTSAPSGTTPEGQVTGTETGTHHPGKKRPYRPSGI